MPNNYNNDYSDIVKKVQKAKSPDNFALIWSVTTIGVSILISLAILFAVNVAMVPDFVKDKLGGLMSGINKTPGISMLGGRQNILLLGVDSNGNNTDPFKSARSDTIMILSLDPFTKTANLLSIPRDSKVYLAGQHGLDKINAAHAFGGPNLTIQTIKETFGINIDHYIAINYQGIRDLVDAIGGIPIQVEKRMRYVDRTARLNIDLYPGYQVLNAKQAEGYLRFRHDAVGDIGRMKRQQWFIRGLVQKMQSPEMIMKIPQLIQLAGKYIRTDMNFYELSQFAAYAKAIDLQNVQTATLPGKPSRYGNISYWILDTEKTQEVIDKIIYRESIYKRYIGLTVSLLYSSGYRGELDEMKSVLKKSGFKVICEAQTREAHSQIISHSEYATFESAKSIRRRIPELNEAQFVVSPHEYPCAETDFTLVLTNPDNNY